MKQQKTIKTPKGTELPLTDIKGKDYLGVPQRLIWFREEKAMWSVETEIIEATEKHAIFKATIKDESGRIIATAHKHETPEGFFDFREKAESGAIGRALGYLGYGTAFALELDEGEQRIVDTPQTPKPLPNRAPGTSPIEKPLNGSWSSYTLKSGKNKGKVLGSVGIGTALSYKMFIEDLRSRGEKIASSLESDLEAITKFQEELAKKNPPKSSNQSTFEPPEPSFDTDEPIPF